MDASSFVQEFINAAEITRPGNEVGWYLTKLLIPPKRAVAAVLLRCHIGYSTAIKATDPEQDRICQQAVWLILKKQCAYLMKSETRVELAKWLNAHVEQHEHDTNLAEFSAQYNISVRTQPSMHYNRIRKYYDPADKGNTTTNQNKNIKKENKK
jgi:hypothetical protein